MGTIHEVDGSSPPRKKGTEEFFFTVPIVSLRYLYPPSPFLCCVMNGSLTIDDISESLFKYLIWITQTGNAFKILPPT
jgi:hypothetical protein